MTPGLVSECRVLLYSTSLEWVAMGTSTKTSVLETRRRKKKRKKSSRSNTIRGDGIGILAGNGVEVIAERVRLGKVN
jgi:hypothetical protein